MADNPHLLRFHADALERLVRNTMGGLTAADPGGFRRAVQRLADAVARIEDAELRLDASPPRFRWHGLAVTCTAGAPQIFHRWIHQARLRADAMIEEARP